jgi:hypothetical protein
LRTTNVENKSDTLWPRGRQENEEEMNHLAGFDVGELICAIGLNSIPCREAVTGNDRGNQGKGEEETQALREDHDGQNQGGHP